MARGQIVLELGECTDVGQVTAPAALPRCYGKSGTDLAVLSGTDLASVWRHTKAAYGGIHCTVVPQYTALSTER
eukprot:3618845-Rhodomonas_salina.1